MEEEIKIKPQIGPQTEFLASPADIVLYGGSAGSGKTYAILIDALWYHDVPGYTSTTFRKNATQIRAPGGLWSESHKLYNLYNGIAKESILEWTFPSGAIIKFAHLDLEKDVYSWQGTALTGIYWDELTHFSRAQFFYMLSRNRSTCGIKPYIKATCNPDADSWVREFIAWWIDNNTGLAITERSGIIRWFIQINDNILWADSASQLLEKWPGSFPKSFTFISASIFDNKKLLDADPGYLANLNALNRVERERLLHGNWNVRPTSGMFFKREYFQVIDVLPRNLTFCRYWDRAATRKNENNDPDFTVGLKLAKDKDGIFYVCDIVRLQESPLYVQNAIKNTTTQDGPNTKIGIEQDPGQAGVSEVDLLIRMLSGFNVKPYKVMKDKVTRASPVSAQSEAGNIRILRGIWNEDFFRELENFPEGAHDDIVDALSGAFLMHTEDKYDIMSLITI